MEIIYKKLGTDECNEFSDSTINGIIKRHIDFWNFSEVKSPLIDKMPFSGFKQKPYPLANGRYIVDPEIIVSHDIHIDRLLGLDRSRPELSNGDLLNNIGCVYPEAWMEALIGCFIYVSAFSCSSKPVEADREEDFYEFSMEYALNSEWLDVMDRIIIRAVDAARGELPVRQLHMRGVVDMLAAYMGEEKLCLALYDCPEKVEELADKFAKLYVMIAQRGLNIRPAWNGGYISVWGVYAPGPLLDYQADASNILSPQLYKRHILKFDNKVIDRFPYSVMHIHACQLHVLDAILEIKNLKAIEITLERETGVWEKERILEACRKIQKNLKCVIINGELSDDELKEFKGKLNPRGLAIFYWNPVG